MLRFFIHYGLHFIVPVIIVYFYRSKHWKKNGLLVLSTMLIDIDHLFASPIYDANRCSVHFHFLHSFPVIYLYFVLLIPNKTRVFAFGLLFHILTDIIDCFLK